MRLDYRVLDQEERLTAFPTRDRLDLTIYETMLRSMIENSQDVAELALNGLTARAMKRRVNTAAYLLGRKLKWKRNPASGTLVFKIMPPKKYDDV